MNRYIEAFKESFNVIALAAVTSVSAMLLSPVPLLLALVAEAAYLIFFTDSRWYESRLSQRHDQEVLRRREELMVQVMPMLPPERVVIFSRLEETRRVLNEENEEDKWFREVLRKLDFLLEKYLQFSLKEVEFVIYLRSVWEKIAPHEAKAAAPWSPSGTGNIWVHDATLHIRHHFAEEMEKIKHLMLLERSDSETTPVLKRRHDVLQRRCEFIDKLGRTLFNINHQLALVEDTFGLVSDEFQARSPEQVLADVDLVVSQTDTMTKLLDDLAPYKTLLRRKQPGARYGLHDTIHIDSFNLDLPTVP